MKTCTKCRNSKEASEYRSHPQTRDRLQSWCKSCTQAAVDAKRLKDPVATYDYYLRRKYGITYREYEAILARQGGGCAICGSSTPLRGKQYLCVDHCHTTGKVRGVLCHGCNTGIGKLQDSPELLTNAINYLNNYG